MEIWWTLRFQLERQNGSLDISSSASSISISKHTSCQIPAEEQHQLYYAAKLFILFSSISVWHRAAECYNCVCCIFLWK